MVRVSVGGEGVSVCAPSLTPPPVSLSQAPEVIRMSEPDPYTPYCDVYSFGVVVYELITSQLPYSHVEGRDTVSFSRHSQLPR